MKNEFFKQPLRICLERSKSFFGYCSSFCRQYLLLVMSSLMVAFHGFQDGLVALSHRLRASALEAWSNPRFRTGVLIALLAVPAWKSCLLFDMNARIEGFFYVNYFFYIITIRSYVAAIFLAIGFFICAPQKWAFKWWVLPFVTFCASEIYAESFYTSYTNFYQSMPFEQMLIVGFAAWFPFLKSIDYLLYRKYHLKDGNIARWKGIIALKNVPAEVKMRLLEDQSLELENFNQRF